MKGLLVLIAYINRLKTKFPTTTALAPLEAESIAAATAAAAPFIGT
jgi:hypothetical protein